MCSFNDEEDESLLLMPKAPDTYATSINMEGTKITINYGASRIGLIEASYQSQAVEAAVSERFLFYSINPGLPSIYSLSAVTDPPSDYST